jgi:hypothetical protein
MHTELNVDNELEFNEENLEQKSLHGNVDLDCLVLRSSEATKPD